MLMHCGKEGATGVGRHRQVMCVILDKVQLFYFSLWTWSARLVAWFWSWTHKTQWSFTRSMSAICIYVWAQQKWSTFQDCLYACRLWYSQTLRAQDTYDHICERSVMRVGRASTFDVKRNRTAIYSASRSASRAALLVFKHQMIELVFCVENLSHCVRKGERSTLGDSNCGEFLFSYSCQQSQYANARTVARYKANARKFMVAVSRYNGNARNLMSVLLGDIMMEAVRNRPHNVTCLCGCLLSRSWTGGGTWRRN